MAEGIEFRIAARDGKARTGTLDDAARRDPHAGLHAGRHRRDGQGDAARKRAGDGRRHPARQHLSPDAAAGGGAGGAARGAACVHELGPADPDRFGRLPGDEPDRAAQADRGGRDVPQPRRRGDASSEPGAEHGDPAAARVGHRDGLRRVHAVPGDPRAGRGEHAAVDALGAAVAGCVRRPAGAGAVWHPAGLGGPGPAGGERGGAGRDRLRRLCDRRAGGGRGAGGDVRRARHRGRGCCPTIGPAT